MRLPPASLRMAARHCWVVMSPSSVLTPRMGFMGARSTPMMSEPTCAGQGGFRVNGLLRVPGAGTRPTGCGLCCGLN